MDQNKPEKTIVSLQKFLGDEASRSKYLDANFVDYIAITIWLQFSTLISPKKEDQAAFRKLCIDKWFQVKSKEIDTQVANNSKMASEFDINSELPDPEDCRVYLLSTLNKKREELIRIFFENQF